MGRRPGDHTDFDRRIYTWLADHPRSTIHAIHQGVRGADNRAIGRALERLERIGVVEWSQGRRDDGVPRREWTVI